MEYLSPRVTVVLIGYSRSYGRYPGGYGSEDRADVGVNRDEGVMDVPHAGGAPKSPAGVHSPDEGRDGGRRRPRTQCELCGPS